MIGNTGGERRGNRGRRGKRGRGEDVTVERGIDTLIHCTDLGSDVVKQLQTPYVVSICLCHI